MFSGTRWSTLGVFSGTEVVFAGVFSGTEVVFTGGVLWYRGGLHWGCSLVSRWSSLGVVECPMSSNE